METVDHRPVYLGIAAPALLVSWAAAVSDHGDYESMFDASAVVLVACEPRDGTDCAGRKQEAVAVSRLQLGDSLGEMREQRYAGAVIVSERRVADVSR